MTIANGSHRYLTRGFGIVAKQVMRDRSISPPARALYALLATYADDEGSCYPSNRTLSEDLGCADSTVRRLLHELEDHGVIERQERSLEGRKVSSTTTLIDVQIGDRSPTSGGGVPPTGGRGVPPTSGRRRTTPLENNTTKNNPSLRDGDPSAHERADDADKPAKRGTQIPPDFQPNETCLALASSLSVDAAFELEQFRDHWLSKGETRKDWQASFRTWLRKSAEFNGRRTGRGSLAVLPGRATTLEDLGPEDNELAQHWFRMHPLVDTPEMESLYHDDPEKYRRLREQQRQERHAECLRVISSGERW